MSEYTPDSISENEPSMEDILASIRKIIADDTPSASANTSSDIDVVKPITDFASDPLDLTEKTSGAASSAALDALDFDLETDAGVLDLTESLIETPAGTPDAVSVTDFDEDFDLVLGEDDSDDDVLDIDSLFNDDDEASLATAPTAIVSDEDILDIDALLESDFDETEFDLDIPAEPERVIDPAAGLLSDDADEIGESLIDDLLGDMDLGDSETSFTEAGTAALGAGAVAGAAGLAGKAIGNATGGDADIDLVKSLMAELTEDEDFEIAEFSDDLDEDLIIPELETPNAIEASDMGDDIDLEDLLSETDDDALSDVTGIAATSAESLAGVEGESQETVSDDLADIVAQSNADIEAAKLDAQTLDTQDIEPLSIYDMPEDDASEVAGDAASSVEDITEAVLSPDAPEPEMAVDDVQAGDDEGSDLAAFAAAAAGSAVIATGASLSGAPDEDEVLDLSDIIPDLDDEAPEEISVPSQAKPNSETKQNTTDLTEDTDMPHIVKSDTIAADETVEAASGAFASLSQVVEEKAVFNESGPRIGDLVQEALKPMLQDWLDKNLKGIVDRAVAKEIKRISSGK